MTVLRALDVLASVMEAFTPSGRANPENSDGSPALTNAKSAWPESPERGLDGERHGVLCGGHHAQRPIRSFSQSIAVTLSAVTVASLAGTKPLAVIHDSPVLVSALANR